MVLAYLRLYLEGVHESEGVELGDPADPEKQTNYYKVASPPPPDKEDLRFKAAQNLSTKEWEWFPAYPAIHQSTALSLTTSMCTLAEFNSDSSSGNHRLDRKSSSATSALRTARQTSQSKLKTKQSLLQHTKRSHVRFRLWIGETMIQNYRSSSEREQTRRLQHSRQKDDIRAGDT
jgi:hypothetical protein